MNEKLVVTQADRDLYVRLLGLPEENRLNRHSNKPIVQPLELLAAHRQAAIAAHSAFIREAAGEERAWDGLPRQIMMWLGIGPKTPRVLFKHLERSDYEVPQWIRDEPEMQNLDHVPSKGTRCVILFRAMLDQIERTQL